MHTTPISRPPLWSKSTEDNVWDPGLWRQCKDQIHYRQGKQQGAKSKCASEACLTKVANASCCCCETGWLDCSWYLIDFSILVILLRPQLWQMDTALADHAVEKLMRGPTSITAALLACWPNWVAEVVSSGSKVSVRSLKQHLVGLTCGIRHPAYLVIAIWNNIVMTELHSLNIHCPYRNAQDKPTWPARTCAPHPKHCQTV